MTWAKLDDNWWRGSDGAWVRREIFTTADNCNCNQCGGRQVGRTGAWYCGWRDGQKPLAWFKSEKEAMRAAEVNDAL